MVGEHGDVTSSGSVVRPELRSFQSARRQTSVLLLQTRLARAKSAELRKRSRQLREKHVEVYAGCTFFLHSLVDGRIATAFWRLEHAVASPPLRARAEIVIGLDDVFEGPEWLGDMRAGFDDPLAALVTFIRASDEVRRVVWLGALDVKPLSRAT
jgi:hypothetical protein